MTYTYIDGTGTIIADTETTKTQVQDEYKAEFGDDLILDDASPQGVLIVAETEQRDALARNNADLANQINPNLAEGIFLDAIMALSGMIRDVGEPSWFTSKVVVTGVAGTPIPIGAIAQTVSGDEFITTEAIVLDGSGNGLMDFVSVVNGPIPCAIGELDTIVTGILGWETVNNTVDATLGTSIQSDRNARLERRTTLGLQGRGVPEAVFGNVKAVSGVKSLAFRANKGAAGFIDGIAMVAHSVWVAVQGGANGDIAEALLKSVEIGADWNGALSVMVQEPVSGQNYTVKFDRPTEIPVEILVTAKTGAAVVDVSTAVKDSILAYANGEIDGEAGFVVGGSVSPFELSGAINELYPDIIVTNVLVDVLGGTPVPDTLVLAIWEVATITRANIAVTVL